MKNKRGGKTVTFVVSRDADVAVRLKKVRMMLVKEGHRGLSPVQGELYLPNDRPSERSRQKTFRGQSSPALSQA